MNRLVILILIIFVLGFSTPEYFERTQVFLTPESQLIIKGKTNINKFSCTFDAINFKNPISANFQNEKGKLDFQDTQLILNTQCFDCGNKHMNNDFYDLLQAKTFPEIILNLRSVSLENQILNAITADISINISGVVNSYKVPLRLINSDTLEVSGALKLNIKDFNIDPPKKALGLIVVSEIIEIDLRLQIAQVSSL